MSPSETSELMDSATLYLSRDGDTVDYICHKFYGSTAALQVETVLEANPGLADLGVVLPSGVKIILPAISRKPKSPVNLFDS